jgi:hypothetical protein
MALPGLFLALLLLHDYRRATSWQQHGGGGGSGSMPSMGVGALTAGSAGGSGEPLKALLLSPRFWVRGLALRAWGGYVVGMVLAMGAGTVFRAAQPALLYLVPCMVTPALVGAAARWVGGRWVRGNVCKVRFKGGIGCHFLACMHT